MLVPLICALILAGLVGRTAKKFNASSTVPVSVAVVCMIFFAAATRGAIRVRANELAKGVVLAVLMYLAAAMVIYIAIYIWLHLKHPQPALSEKPASTGLLRFRAFLGVRDQSIHWKYPLGIYLGFFAMMIAVLIRVGDLGILQRVIHDAVTVAIMVLGFHFLRRLHYSIVTVTVALVCGSLNFGIYALLQRSLFIHFVQEFVFVLVFILILIWLLKSIGNPWIALAIGIFLALTIGSLVTALNALTYNANFSIIKNYLLSFHWLWKLLYSVVFTGGVFGFYKIMQMDLSPLMLRKKSAAE